MAERYMDREELVRQIMDIISGIDDTWILRQIYRFCTGMLR